MLGFSSVHYVHKGYKKQLRHFCLFSWDDNTPTLFHTRRSGSLAQAMLQNTTHISKAADFYSLWTDAKLRTRQLHTDLLPRQPLTTFPPGNADAEFCLITGCKGNQQILLLTKVRISPSCLWSLKQPSLQTKVQLNLSFSLRNCWGRQNCYPDRQLPQEAQFIRNSGPFSHL